MTEQTIGYDAIDLERIQSIIDIGVDVNDTAVKLFKQALEYRDAIEYKPKPIIGYTVDEILAKHEDTVNSSIDDTERNHDDFAIILNEMMYTYVRKNADYGNSFDKSLDDDGLLVAKIRLMDKMNQFSSLISKDAQVQDESLRDTLLDLANYAAMTVKWMDSTNGHGGI